MYIQCTFIYTLQPEKTIKSDISLSHKEKVSIKNLRIQAVLSYNNKMLLEHAVNLTCCYTADLRCD